MNHEFIVYCHIYIYIHKHTCTHIFPIMLGNLHFPSNAPTFFKRKRQEEAKAAAVQREQEAAEAAQRAAEAAQAAVEELEAWIC